MALKDWKKTNEGFVNKKTKHLILFGRTREFGGIQYVVNPQTFSIGEHFFKTELQAVRFAKSYMRKH